MRLARVFTALGVAPRADHRRRAAAPARSARPRPAARGRRRPPGSGAHHERRAARRISRRRSGRRACTASPSASTRCGRIASGRSRGSTSCRACYAGIERRARALRHVKIDSVIVRGTNEDEIVALLDYARRIGAEVRFIEYMDVGGATRWSPERVVSRAEMLRVHRSRATARSRPSSTARGRRRIGSRSRGRHRRSGSSRRRPSRSAGRATAAASPPTACGSAVSTRATGIGPARAPAVGGLGRGASRA